MRELAASGYISQSVRMAAAAYLVDYCNIDWREGARHFHDWLVDGAILSSLVGTSGHTQPLS